MSFKNRCAEMGRLFKMIIVSFLLLSIVSCKNKVESNSPKEAQVVRQNDTIILEGNYVSDGYAERSEGYDWVAISVKQLSTNEIFVSVRSRADRKKPTCTFDTKAYKANDSTFTSIAEGSSIIIRFSSNGISISTEKPDEESALYFYCSGGASLAGDYTKIKEPLDETQIDKTIFHKVLTLQNIGFNISTRKNGISNELTIAPFGLSIDNRPVTHQIDGTVTNSEIEDLNSDGFPEVIVYTTSTGSGSYGDVIGYSVNNGKSMSRIYFHPVAENPNINRGYMGHDEFAIVETSLVQRFQTYNEGDTNAEPTGKIRQIQYRLEDGEASRAFVVNGVTEYDRK